MRKVFGTQRLVYVCLAPRRGGGQKMQIRHCSDVAAHSANIMLNALFCDVARARIDNMLTLALPLTAHRRLYMYLT